MTSLTSGGAGNTIRNLMQQIIAERDAKFAPKQEGGEAAPTGGMFDKPEVKTNEADAITDLLGYLEQKRSEALDSYQSKVMRRASKPLPKPEDIDVSSFLSEAGLSPQPDGLTALSFEAPELGAPDLDQVIEAKKVRPSKKPMAEVDVDVIEAAVEQPAGNGLMSSPRPKARPEQGLTDDDMGLASESGYGFMAPNSLFRKALKEKEAGSYSSLFGNSEKVDTPNVNSAGLAVNSFKDTDITTMPMSEVMDFVKNKGAFHKYNLARTDPKTGKPKPVNTTAIGKYQFVGATLRDLKKRGVFDKLGITDDTLFDEATQDSLAAYQAVHRIKDRAKGTLSSAREEMRNEWEGFKDLSDSALNNIITEIGSEIGVKFSDRTDPLRTSRPKTRK